MYYKFSKLAKAIIIINVLLTIAFLLMHSYNIYRINETAKIISEWMAQNNETWQSSIYTLQRNGVELFINREFATYFGVFITTLTLILSYKFAKHNSFFVGLFLIITSMLSSVVGGVLLLFLIFSGKSETEKNKKTNNIKDAWEEFVHQEAAKK